MKLSRLAAIMMHEVYFDPSHRLLCFRPRYDGAWAFANLSASGRSHIVLADPRAASRDLYSWYRVGLSLAGTGPINVALRDARQSGNAIFILFIAIALLAALSWAFLQGTRSSVALVEGERDKATATKSLDCANTIQLATKRLEMRGCGALISSLPDGSNTNPGAPQDGSCSIYHPNGGGAKNCGAAPATGAPCGPSPTVGQVCDDGSIYAGLSPDGNVPMFITDAAFEASMSNWGPNQDNGVPHCVTGGEASCTTGEANTATFAADPANTIPAYCANLTAHGHNDWYLPARSEYSVLSIMHQSGFGSLRDAWYYSSSESSSAHSWLVHMTAGSFHQMGWKPNTDFVRCARKSL